MTISVNVSGQAVSLRRLVIGVGGILAGDVKVAIVSWHSIIADVTEVPVVFVLVCVLVEKGSVMTVRGIGTVAVAAVVVFMVVILVGIVSIVAGPTDVVGAVTP